MKLNRNMWKLIQMNREQNKSLTLFFLSSFSLVFFLESESIHKTSFARLLIEWRKSEDFLQLYLGTHYVIKPSHYGTYFELRKEIISRLYSWIIFFFNLWYTFISFIIYNIQFSVVYIIRSYQLILLRLLYNNIL